MSSLIKAHLSWRVKRALTRELDGKLSIAVYAHTWLYIGVVSNAVALSILVRLLFQNGDKKNWLKLTLAVSLHPKHWHSANSNYKNTMSVP